jgi:surfeit locus 1 family protein
MTKRGKFWLMTLAAVFGVVLTLSLGRWQLSRAAQKEDLQAAIESQGRRAPLGNAELIAAHAANAVPMVEIASQLHRRVQLRGSWVGARTVFLDNRQMDAKPGFYVVTPLRLQDSPYTVLVQRGWAPRDFQDRNQLPRVDTPPETVEIDARVAPAPAKLVDLGEDGHGAIRQNLDMTAFANETGLALLPVSVVQTNAPDGRLAQNDGLLRNWPVPASGASKNYGYAAQWFALSALIGVLYGWLGLIKPRMNPVNPHA